jgi:hypothetical protein
VLGRYAMRRTRADTPVSRVSLWLVWVLAVVVVIEML